MQEARRPLYERTTAFKIYVSTVMPGLIQTPGYAKALMSAITAFRETPDDVEDAVTARMNRNRILGSGNRRFTILKARFAPAPEPVRLFFPPKWGINDKLPAQPAPSSAKPAAHTQPALF